MPQLPTYRNTFTLGKPSKKWFYSTFPGPPSPPSKCGKFLEIWSKRVKNRQDWRKSTKHPPPQIRMFEQSDKIYKFFNFYQDWFKPVSEVGGVLFSKQWAQETFHLVTPSVVSQCHRTPIIVTQYPQFLVSSVSGAGGIHHPDMVTSVQVVR